MRPRLIKNKPLVSVIIATYNRKELVLKAIQSVLDQTYENYEVIVVDDASTDGTQEAIQERFSDVRIIRLEENVRAAEARNVGIREARGEYLSFLDSDDLWIPTFLDFQVNRLEAHPEHVLSHCSYWDEIFTGHYEVICTKPLIPTDTKGSILLDPYILSMSLIVVRREAAEKAGWLDSSFVILHDTEWYSRLINHGPFLQIGEALVVRHRKSENCLTGDVFLLNEEEEKFLNLFLSREENASYCGMEKDLRHILKIRRKFKKMRFYKKSTLWARRIRMKFTFKYFGWWKVFGQTFQDIVSLLAFIKQQHFGLKVEDSLRLNTWKEKNDMLAHKARLVYDPICWTVRNYHIKDPVKK